jgi:hypothetical protein
MDGEKRFFLKNLSAKRLRFLKGRSIPADFVLGDRDCFFQNPLDIFPTVSF